MDGSASRGRILVIDDDRVFGLWVTKVLGPRGFEIRHVLDPVTGLNLVEAESWDVVITDIEMPRMTGLEFLERVRRLVPGLPVAVITAHATMDRAMTAMLQPATQFIQKPVDAGSFVAQIEDMVAQRRPAPMPHPDSVLAVGAHPGDADVGAAGTLLAHQEAGVPVTVLTLAPGGGHGTAPDAAGPGERLTLDDLTGDTLAAAVGSLIGRLWPTVIYTHSIHDSDPDHRQAHLAVMAAAERVDNVYCYQSPSATIGFQPDRLVPIDGRLDGKLAAIRAFAAEPEIRSSLESDLITSTAAYWARYCGARHVEAFEVVRDREGTELGAGVRGVVLVRLCLPEPLSTRSPGSDVEHTTISRHVPGKESSNAQALRLTAELPGSATAPGRPGRHRGRVRAARGPDRGCRHRGGHRARRQAQHPVQHRHQLDLTVPERRIANSRNADRGAAAVEFALVLPVLLLIVFGIIDLGRALNAQITLTEAAREGARLAALGESNVVSRTQAAATGLSPVSVTVTSSCPASATQTSDAVVKVSYSFSFITPISAFTALFGVSGPGSGLTMSAQGTMPCDG